MKAKLTLVTLSLLTVLSSFGADIAREANKKLVREFYELAFNQHKPTEAARKYIGGKYIQHNSHLPNGAEPFCIYFEGYFRQHPQSRAEIKRIAADGNLVWLHLHSKENHEDRGQAIIDIFRIEKGKIVEHWDVSQDVPEKSANSNTLF